MEHTKILSAQLKKQDFHENKDKLELSNKTSNLSRYFIMAQQMQRRVKAAPPGKKPVPPQVEEEVVEDIPDDVQEEAPVDDMPAEDVRDDSPDVAQGEPEPPMLDESVDEGEELPQDMGDIQEPEAEQGQEKYSAQVLRRMHEDASILLEEYDEMRGPLEHPHVDKYLQRKLEGIVSDIEEIEMMWSKHHPDNGPLGPSMDDVPEEMGDNGTMPSDSREEELPTPDEAVEGMNAPPRQMKSLKKSLCPNCNGSPCQCEGMTKKDTELSLGSNPLQDHEKPHVHEAHGFLTELGTAGIFDDESRKKSYHYHKMLGHIGWPKTGFKKDMSADDPMPEGSSMGEVGTMRLNGNIGKKSEEIHGARIKKPVMLPGQKPEDPYDKDKEDKKALAYKAYGDDDYHKGYRWHKDVEEKSGDLLHDDSNASFEEQIHPHRQACRDASMFFKLLSDELAYGDPHREEAMRHAEGLRPIILDQEDPNQDEEVLAEDEVLDEGVPGEETPLDSETLDEVPPGDEALVEENVPGDLDNSNATNKEELMEEEEDPEEEMGNMMGGMGEKRQKSLNKNRKSLEYLRDQQDRTADAALALAEKLNGFMARMS
jgi:hypothetical protein